MRTEKRNPLTGNERSKNHVSACHLDRTMSSNQGSGDCIVSADPNGSTGSDIIDNHVSWVQIPTCKNPCAGATGGDIARDIENEHIVRGSNQDQFLSLVEGNVVNFDHVHFTGTVNDRGSIDIVETLSRSHGFQRINKIGSHFRDFRFVTMFYNSRNKVTAIGMKMCVVVQKD